MTTADLFPYESLTWQINNAAYTVHGKLGSGFLEKIYENALVIELRKRGLKFQRQYPLKVYYDSELVGEYIADLLVEDKVIVELKAVEAVIDVHEAQLINYLRVTGVKVGLLINFGSSVEVRRKYN